MPFIPAGYTNFIMVQTRLPFRNHPSWPYALCCPAKVFDGVKILHAKAYQPAPPPATNNTAATPNASATNNNAAPT